MDGIREYEARAELKCEAAYRRPCFICGTVGFCRHREPFVELAIVGAVADARMRLNRAENGVPLRVERKRA